MVTSPSTIRSFPEALALLDAVTTQKDDQPQRAQSRSLAHLWTWVTTGANCSSNHCSELIKRLSPLLSSPHVLTDEDREYGQKVLSLLTVKSLSASETSDSSHSPGTASDRHRLYSSRVTNESSGGQIFPDGEADLGARVKRVQRVAKSIGIPASPALPSPTPTIASATFAFLPSTQQQVIEILQRHLPSESNKRLQISVETIFRQILLNGFESLKRYSKKQTQAPFTYRLTKEKGCVQLKVILPQCVLGKGSSIKAIGSLSFNLPLEGSSHAFTYEEKATLRGDPKQLRNYFKYHEWVFNHFQGRIPILSNPLVYPNYAPNKMEAEMPWCIGTLLDASRLRLDTQLDRQGATFRLTFSHHFKMLSLIAQFILTLHRERVLHGDVKPDNFLLRFSNPTESTSNQRSLELFLHDFDHSQRVIDDFNPRQHAYYAWDICSNMGFFTTHSDLVGFATVLFSLLRRYKYDPDYNDFKRLKTSNQGAYPQICLEHLSDKDAFLPENIKEAIQENGFTNQARELLVEWTENATLTAEELARAQEQVVEFFIFERVFLLLETILNADRAQQKHADRLDMEAQAYEGKNPYGAYSFDRLFNELKELKKQLTESATCARTDSQRVANSRKKEEIADELRKRILSIHEAAHFPSLEGILSELQAIEKEAEALQMSFMKD